MGALEVPGLLGELESGCELLASNRGPESHAGFRAACRDVLTEEGEEFRTWVLLTYSGAIVARLTAAAHGPVRADRVVPPALREEDGATLSPTDDIIPVLHEGHSWYLHTGISHPS